MAATASMDLTDDSISPQGSPAAHNDHPSSNSQMSPTLSSHGHSSASGLNGGPILNPRSCVICRRRKVRCNKTYPCSNCAKAKVQCVFPAPERAKRRPRKPPDGELMNRLRRLEGVIQGMGMSVEEELASSEASGGHDQNASPRTAMGQAMADSGGSKTPRSPGGGLSNDFGRLVVNEGKSRYVNNRFWSSLTNEIEDLKGILDQTSDEEQDYPSPSTDQATPPPDYAFFFNYSSVAPDLQSFHPPPEHIWESWQIFKDYNDPVIKMVHIPSMEKQIKAHMHHPAKSHKPLETFLFSIYFAVVTALSPEDCVVRFGESRDALVRRYRFAVEQALARANFLITEELLVLQAFITYLVCLRCHEDGRAVWALNGVAVRLAISMGLQRDGSNFDISPFEAEMRRRVWWQLAALEWRGSQDSGIEPVILNQGSDTLLPLNVNDEDLSPGMTHLPEPRKGLTDMTFCILRYDLQKSLYKLFSPLSTLQEKEKLITEAHQHLEDNYFKYCDMTQPLDWTICTVAKLIMARQFLVLYHPHLKTLPQATIDRLFVTALDTIEFALRLETERKMVKWGWLFKTYNQWHAMAFMLSELTRRTKGPMVQRAWRAVNSTLAQFHEQSHENKRGQLWRPVVKLFQSARQARERELALEAQTLLNQPRPQTDQNPIASHMAMASANMLAMGPTGQEVKFEQGQGFRMPLGSQPTESYGLDAVSASTLGMPMLEPSISARSNPIDDKYQFDNTSNNVPTTSQFFANTPGLWQGQGLTSPTGGGAGGDWFGNWALENNVTTAATDFDASTLNQYGMNPQATFGQDPMVSGSDTTGVQWTDWDEVMAEFDADAGQSGARGSWSKPALMRETWL